MEQQTYDVIVIGFGGAGACATIEAADAGASVLVLERFDGGGATSRSGGVVYAGGGTTTQREAGFAARLRGATSQRPAPAPGRCYSRRCARRRSGAAWSCAATAG